MTEADTTHVDAFEAGEADAHTIGDGTAESAPEKAPKVSLLEGQPTAVIGTVVTIATALLASPAIPLPGWLKAGLSALVAVAGVFGIYSKVTPVAAPKLDADTPLTP